jgi:CRISPR-associated endonuclease/helicase Cas3
MERKSFLSAGSNVLFDPSFRAFFRACTGHDPFPWQERFAEACEKGTPPHVVNVPTGLGKTPGTIVGWVWSLAKAAEQPKTRQVPMRFIHVSPRRTIVDQTARLIDRIALVLKDPSTIQDQEAQEAAKWVADRLLSFTSNEGSPLLSARLRGGVQSNLSWRDRIDQPMAIASTSDLAGSGLLFRHWISSPSSWPVIAGLFGVDCVWVLDEAHLLEPLKSTILRCREAEERSPLRLPWWLISTTATPGETSGQMLGLSKQDCKNKTVRRRLEVKRKVTLREVEKNELEDRLVNLTLAAAKEKNAVLVVVDTVSQARKVFELISKKDRGAGGDGRILLLHGQQREHDRAQVLDKALTVFGMDTPPKENSDGLRDNGWYLIATNAIEVGVDLSADYLVTVACSGDSLLQRLGRLGRRADQVSYECYVVAVKNDDVKKRNNKLKKNKDSKNEEKETATLAEQYEQVVRDVVEKLKPGVTVTPLNPCGLNELISPRPHPVPLTSSDLRALVQTRPAPVDSPNVDALIHGLDDPYPTVFIAWRRDLDPEIESPENVWPWLLKSWPLRSHELLPVPIWELNGWLIEKRMTKTSFLLCEHGEQVRFVSEKTYVEIPVGSTIILPSVYGGHDGFGFNPTKTEPVEDIADLVVGDDVKVVGARLRLFNEDFEGAELKSLYDAFLKEVDDPDRDESYALGLLRSILEKLAEQENDARAKPAKFLRCLDDENLEWKLLDESTKLIGVTALRRNIDDDDELSLIRPVELEEHLADVASCAYNMAMRVGVQESFALVVGHAGLYHDIGKAEERFQASLYGGRQRRPDEPRLAKSGLPRRKWAQASRNAGVPRFFRHEALSEIIAMKRTNELVAHLAGAHHGWGRPWFPPIVSRFKPVIEVSVGSVSDNIHDNELQSKIPLDRARRFWWLNTVIGPWSLAWLEAALRLADHMVSGTPKIKSAKEINNQPVPDMC